MRSYGVIILGHEVGGACRKHAEIRNAHRILAGETEQMGQGEDCMTRFNIITSLKNRTEVVRALTT